MDVDNLGVLDLTDPAVTSALGVTEAALVSDDYDVTLSIAVAAVEAGFNGILAPSAALTGRRTIVVFPNGMPAVTAGPSPVRQPPPRMTDLLTAIRAHPDVLGSVQGLLRSISAGGRETVRRLRHRNS